MSQTSDLGLDQMAAATRAAIPALAELPDDELTALAVVSCLAGGHETFETYWLEGLFTDLGVSLPPGVLDRWRDKGPLEYVGYAIEQMALCSLRSSVTYWGHLRRLFALHCPALYRTANQKLLEYSERELDNECHESHKRPIRDRIALYLLRCGLSAAEDSFLVLMMRGTLEEQQRTISLLCKEAA